MASYVIGVKPGQAGASVEIVTPTGSGSPSPFGSTAYLGAFRWGPLGSVVRHGSKDHYRAVRGEPIEGDFTALAVEHGFQLGGDSLRALTLRLTDGSERESATALFNRITHHGWRDGQPAGSGTPWNVAFRLLGAFPGRRGGARLRFGGVTVAALPTSGSTFGAELTGDDWPFGKDELKGAYLHFQGITAPWQILANDTAGEMTVAGEFGATPTGNGWWVSRENEGPSGLAEHVGARIENDPVQPYLWRTVPLLNGREAGESYDAVGNGADQRAYFATRINNGVTELRQLAVKVAGDAFPEGGDPKDERYKPATWVGFPLSVSDGSATLCPVGYWREEGSAVFPDLNTTLNSIPSDAVPCQIRCLEAGGGLYDVEVLTIDGERVLVPLGQVQATVDSPLTLSTRFPWLPNILLRGTPGPGDVHIYVNPLPPDIAKRSAYLYPNALSSQGSIHTRLRVRSNTGKSVEVLLAPGDVLGNYIEAPTKPSATGTATDAAALNKDETVIITDDGGTERTFTVAALSGAGPFTIAAIAVALNTSVTTVYGAGKEKLVFGTDATGRLTVTTTEARGAAATFTIDKDGTLNTAVGFDDAEDTTATGEDGSTVVVAFDAQCEGGFDGVGALGEASEYEAAMDTEASPLLKLTQVSLGLVKLVTPGIAVADVINAGVALADALGWRYVPTLPSNLATQQQAIDWLLANIPLKDSARAIANAYWPSWGTARRNPFGPQDLLVPVCGPALGLAAAYAERYRGYWKVVAGENADLSPVIKALPTDVLGRGEWIDDAPLNQVGLTAVQHEGPKVMIWGARSPEIGGSGTIWSHKWDVLLHVGQELRVLSRKFTFEPIPDVWPNIRRFARDILRPHWIAGAFKGTSFEDAFTIEVNATNNPEEVQNAGRVICAITAKGIKDTSEQVRWVVGTTGVAVVSL